MFKVRNCANLKGIYYDLNSILKQKNDGPIQ